MIDSEKLWRTLAVPPNFSPFSTKLHEGQQGQVMHNESLLDSLSISTGVKQGYVLAPTLFSILFYFMLREAKEDFSDGNYIRFRTDGSVFDLRRLLSRTKTIEELITELPFSESCADLAHTDVVLQNIANRFPNAAKDCFVLAIIQTVYVNTDLSLSLTPAVGSCGCRN